MKMTRLSCHRLRANEVRLWLSLIAYNLGNLWQRLALPKGIGNWSLTSLQQRLGKTAFSAVGGPVRRETGPLPALLGTLRNKTG